MRKNEQLAELLAPSVEALGYEWVGVSYHPNSVNALLRVYIDKDEGIQLGDCIAVSEQIGAILDVEDPIAGKYTLEVSSPGLDRPLFSLADFEKFVGLLATIHLTKPLGRQRNFTGEIVAVDVLAQSIKIKDADNSLHIIELSQVDTARLVPVFDD